MYKVVFVRTQACTFSTDSMPEAIGPHLGHLSLTFIFQSNSLGNEKSMLDAMSTCMFTQPTLKPISSELLLSGKKAMN